jgi:hypothetical protein
VSISLSSQPTERSAIFLDAGNSPARTSRQIVVRDKPVRAIIAWQRKIFGFSEETLSTRGAASAFLRRIRMILLRKT